MWKCEQCETINDDDRETCSLCNNKKPVPPKVKPPSEDRPSLKDKPSEGTSPSEDKPPVPPSPGRDLRRHRWLAILPVLLWLALETVDLRSPVLNAFAFALWAGGSVFLTMGLFNLDRHGRLLSAGAVFCALALCAVLFAAAVGMYQSGLTRVMTQAQWYLRPGLALTHVVLRSWLFARNKRRMEGT
jgi:hypothetical protein